MKGAGALVWGQWRSIVRRPVNLVFIVLLPLTMAVVFGSMYQGMQGGSHDIGIVAEGDGPVTQRLVADLEASPLTITRFSDRDDAERSVRRRDIDAVVVIPATIDEPDRHPIEVELVGAPGVAEPGGLRSTVQLSTTRVAALVVAATRADPTAPLGTRLEQAEEAASAAGIDEFALDTNKRTRNSNARALFGMLVLFTFMNVIAGGGDLATLREQGVLSRLRATTMRDRDIVAGFIGWLASYGMIQAGVLLVGGTAILGIHWDRPLLLVLTVAIVALAAASLSALLSTFLPPYPVGTSVAGGIAFTLGLIGGCLWSLDNVSMTMRAIGYMTPQAWALSALMSTVDGTGAGSTARSLVILVGFTILSGLLAAALVRRRVQSTV